MGVASGSAGLVWAVPLFATYFRTLHMCRTLNFESALFLYPRAIRSHAFLHSA